MLTIPGLKNFSCINHFISDRHDGNLSYYFNGIEADKDVVQKNRKELFQKIGVDIHKTVGIWVEGEDRVLKADPDLAGKSMLDKEHAVRCDSLITDIKGLYLFLLIADCLPVIIFDPFREVMAVVHVGWKGAHLEIAKKTIQMLETEYGADPRNLIIGFGPSARKDSFVKKNPSQKDDSRWKGFIEHLGGDSFKVDIAGFCKKQILDMGVAERNINDCGIDTILDANYFSHTRDHSKPNSQQGRFACIVGLK